MKTPILVLGATGTVGSAVAKQLDQAGKSFSVAVRDPEKLEKPYPYVLLDYQDATTFAPALKDKEALFMLTPSFADQLLPAFEQLIATAKKESIKHLVFMSAIGTEQNPEGFHRKVEVMIEKSGIPYTFLRPNFFMQNFFTYEKAQLDKGIIYLPTGDGKASYIDVVDIAHVATAVLGKAQHYGKAYDLTGPEAISTQEIANVLGRVLGRPIKHVNPSEEEYEAALEKQGMPKPMIERSKALYRYIREGYLAAISDAVEEITGEPPLPFEAFAKRCVNLPRT